MVSACVPPFTLPAVRTLVRAAIIRSRGIWLTVRNILYDIVRGADMNVTFSGGDPMLQAGALCALARRIKEECGKTIWCYTGYLFENLLTRPDTRELLAYIDVLVDGPFILAERDLSLRFRGSRNQRLIDVRRSISGKQTVEFQL